MLNNNGGFIFKSVIASGIAQKREDLGLVVAELSVEIKVWHLDLKQIIAFENHFFVGDQFVHFVIILAVFDEFVPKFLETLLG